MAAQLTTATLLLSALIATAGVALALVARAAFAGSPFGRLMDLLAVVLALFAGYHGLLLVTDAPSLAIAESAAFTGLLLYVGLMFRLHHRLSRRPRGPD